jgi:glycosyltransferase involved in cell wall biosynthesis
LIPRRNVLHVVDSLGLGGVQTILKAYLEANAADARTALYALRLVPQQVAIAHPRVTVHRAGSRFSAAPLLELRRIVREASIGVLHCHLFRSQVFGWLARMTFARSTRLLFHEHGRVVGREGQTALEAWLFRTFLRLSWRSVDKYLCISEFTRECLARIIPAAAGRMVVVLNPIPSLAAERSAPDRDRLRRSFGVPEGHFVVGFAGRLIERKGWSEFLDAVARIAEAHRVYFLVAGDGEDRAKIDARVLELGISPRGRVLGRVDAMRDFYACLDCLVMPSHWEPHGLAHLEAQSCGVPVVVADVPGLRETVHPETDAVLCAPKDSEALAACIARVASDPALRRLLAANGPANASLYSVAAFSRRLDDIYEEVLR